MRAIWSLPLYAAAAAAALVAAPHLGRIDTESEAIRELIMQMRWSRALLAAVAGGGLALAGALLQALLRNPLATPFTLGIASSASLGAVATFTLLASFAGSLLAPATTAGAMLGAFLSLGLVYLVSRSRRGGVSTETLLLAGVAVSTGAGALLLALLIHADPTQTGEILRWLMGSITEDPGRGASRALGLSGFVLAALTFGVLYASQLNILVFGDDVAAGRGVDVARLRLAVYVMAGVLTAAVVALTGPIGFVGLVIPHACRLLTGPDHRVLLPASCLLGATYLTLCDALARSLLEHTPLPVGIVTAAFGGPAFIALLVARAKTR